MAETIHASGGDERRQSLGIVNRVKETATARLTTQRDRGVDALGNVAEAVRSTTQKLREEQHDTIAQYVDRAADQIDEWSQRLRQKDVHELVADLQRLARRRPGVFIGSAFALGLLTARFLKSSQADREFTETSGRRQVSGGEEAGIANAADMEPSTGVATRTRTRRPASRTTRS